MRTPISAKYQFSCTVLISLITISVNSFNNKLQDPLYHCILHMHWHLKQNPIQWLYDQRIPCLQGCLVELHWRSAVLSLWWKKCRRTFGSFITVKQIWNIYSPEALVKRQLNQTTRHRNVTRAAMTELKWRYTCDYGMQLKPAGHSSHKIHTN